MLNKISLRCKGSRQKILFQNPNRDYSVMITEYMADTPFLMRSLHLNEIFQNTLD